MVIEDIEEIIRRQLDYTLKETNFKQLGNLYRGKVRDNYIKEDKRIIGKRLKAKGVERKE